MSLPTASDVHVNAALTNISIAYLQQRMNFAASRVFPNVPVEKQSDVYYEFDRGDFNRDEAEVRAPGAESAGGGYRLDSTASYFAKVWAYHHDVPDQILANADAAVPQMRAASEIVAHKMLIKKEKEFASNYMAAGVWDNDFDGTASSPSATEAIHWDDQTNGTPIEDVRSAKDTVLQNTGFEPNKLILGKQVFTALVDHPDIVDRIKYSGGVGNTNPALANEQTLAQIFGVDEIIISKAVENTAAEAATDSHSFIVGKDALLVYAPSNPGIMVPSAGYVFSWTNYLGVGNEFGAAVRNFRLEKNRVERVEGEVSFDMKLVSSALGFFWDGIIS